MSKDMLAIGSKPKPPVLVIREYQQWQKRMVQFLDLIDPDLMRSIEDGPTKVFVKVDVVADTANTPMLPSYEYPKPYEMYDPQEKECVVVDIKALTYLTMALSNEVFCMVDSLDNAKVVWEELERQLNLKSMGLHDLYSIMIQQDDDVDVKTEKKSMALIFVSQGDLIEDKSSQTISEGYDRGREEIQGFAFKGLKRCYKDSVD
ncbi:hypothetical protein OSB04_027838 [Centaurea solstitialis]|uniref:Uncharacterized protein n=1 Tax=Centaurea solstitialis TaxID=347529 RepID=A0AA38SY46_9ASTR|nr:hypothetical protein OSB04_027838 [Centaurea solstitialis]